jgi:hypothetical protein
MLKASTLRPPSHTAVTEYAHHVWPDLDDVSRRTPAAHYTLSIRNFFVGDVDREPAVSTTQCDGESMGGL